MYLSAEMLALANQQVQETFAQSSVIWQAIPHWNTGDPAQTKVRSDIASAQYPAKPDPFDGAPINLDPQSVPFYVSLAQASAPTPDALVAAVIARTVELAWKVDDDLLPKLYAADKTPAALATTDPQSLLDALIAARAEVEKAGYRAPSCLLTNTYGLTKLSYLDGGYSVLDSLLYAANINSLLRVDKFDASDKKVRLFLLGRRQRIAHGSAAGASPGEEPVDLAVSVPPSLEVVGETGGNVELAVRIRYALRIKDANGFVAIKEN